MKNEPFTNYAAFAPREFMMLFASLPGLVRSYELEPSAYYEHVDEGTCALQEDSMSLKK